MVFSLLPRTLVRFVVPPTAKVWNSHFSCLDRSLNCNQNVPTRLLSLSVLRFQDEQATDSEVSDDKKKNIDPDKDRSKVIPVELSMKYMESQAYKEAYGDQLIWKLYRRNHKGPFTPRQTRKTCIRNNVISTGNPCPICRDEYLVVDYRNLKLLKQFISPYSEEVVDAYYTGETFDLATVAIIRIPFLQENLQSKVKWGVCRVKHFQLQVAIAKAKDHGYLPYYVPKRVYNYEEYYSGSDEK